MKSVAKKRFSNSRARHGIPSILSQISESEIRDWLVAKAESIHYTAGLPASEIHLTVSARRHSDPDPRPSWDVSWTLGAAGVLGYVCGGPIFMAVEHLKAELRDPEDAITSLRRKADQLLADAASLECLSQKKAA